MVKTKLWYHESMLIEGDNGSIRQQVDDRWRVYFLAAAAAAAKSLQSCLTLCDPIDGSPPGSPIPGILQARTLEWVAIPFSNAWKWKVKGKSLSHVQLFETPWTAVHQAPPSMGFSRQEVLEWGAIAFSDNWYGFPLLLILMDKKKTPSFFLHRINKKIMPEA